MDILKQIVFREPVDSDLSEIWDLLQNVSTFFPSQTENILERVINQDSAFLRVAELKKVPIGFGSLFVHERIRGGKIGLIEDLVVSSEYRNLGVGRALIETLLGKAWKLGCHKVSLQSSPDSQDFYGSLGFEVAGRAFQINKPIENSVNGF